MVIRLGPQPLESSSASRLPDALLAPRAQRLCLVLSDCDGVLTDGSVYVSANGEEQKRFSLRDGMGVELLREAGIETAIVTRERSPIVARRAEKLRVRLFEGVRDKALALPSILAETAHRAAEVAYIGDDRNDLEVMQLLAAESLTGAPWDAQPALAAAAHYRCRASGGAGAFREFADWLLWLRGLAEAGQDDATGVA